MKAIILAAGEGLRMRPLTLFKPKPMLELAGKPLLHRILEILPQAINEVILVVGYKADMIKDYFGGSFLDKKITYAYQKTKRGTADALLLARPYLNPKEKFLLLYADDLHDKESVKKCIKNKRGLLVCEIANPSNFGVVVTDQDGAVLDIEEKPQNPKSNLAAVGVYVLDSKIFGYTPEKDKNGEYFLTTMLQKMIKDYRMSAVKTDFWHPIGYPEDLKNAEKILKERKQI